MDNNDVLKRIRYIFDYSDSKMIEIFGLAKHKVDRDEVCNWLRKDDEPNYRELTENELAIFLSGLIIEKRGKKDGRQPVPETRLNNNVILRKLKIALDLKTDDILEIYKLADKKISAHELSAFFRNHKQSQFRFCNDQYLRNFLNGLKMKYRPQV